MLIGAILIGLASSLGSQPFELWLRYIGLIVFSIIGIVGALRIVETSDLNNALLMFLAGVGMLLCVQQLGIFPALLFFIGGALIYLKKG